MGADRRAATHYRRREGGEIETRLLAQGRIVLDLPDPYLAVEDFYAA